MQSSKNFNQTQMPHNRVMAGQPLRPGVISHAKIRSNLPPSQRLRSPNAAAFSQPPPISVPLTQRPRGPPFPSSHLPGSLPGRAIPPNLQNLPPSGLPPPRLRPPPPAGLPLRPIHSGEVLRQRGPPLHLPPPRLSPSPRPNNFSHQRLVSPPLRPSLRSASIYLPDLHRPPPNLTSLPSTATPTLSHLRHPPPHIPPPAIRPHHNPPPPASQVYRTDLPSYPPPSAPSSSSSSYGQRYSEFSAGYGNDYGHALDNRARDTGYQQYDQVPRYASELGALEYDNASYTGYNEQSPVENVDLRSKLARRPVTNVS